ncbi:MAG: hypothetical protein IJE01_00075 [Clostridia bacterium]|nr:hypothetical protein [Clostridia bacterium]
MKLRVLKFIVSLTILLTFLWGLVVYAFAVGTEIKLDEHKLSLSLPQGFNRLTTSTSKEMSEQVEAFGYTTASFKTYLEQNKILIFATEEKGKTQLSLKCWETDFSKDVVDLSVFDGAAMSTVAAKLITIPGSSYKTVAVNGMKMFEVRKEDKDSGGDFYSVQYITVRNSKIYSLNMSFAGKESTEKVQTAWQTVQTLKIDDNSTSAKWGFSSVFEMVIIWVMIIAAIIATYVIVVSFVKDYKKHKADLESGNDTIHRKKM